MSTQQKVFSVIVIQLAALGIILCAILIWLAWAYNTPVTDSLTRGIAGTQTVLAAADRGLQVTNRGLNTALAAVNTIDGATRTVGERLVENSLVFFVLERTVGDTLFPRVLAAQEMITAVTDTIVGVNSTLEAANRMPFVNVPTFTNELEAASGRLGAARARVDEIRAGIRAIKEQHIARPVSFVTDRTGLIITDLDSVLATTTRAQVRINVTLARLEFLQANIARIIDLVSVVTTFVMVWLIGNQGYVLIRAYERLAGKPIDWAGMKARLRPNAEGAIDAAAEQAEEPATEPVAETGDAAIDGQA